MFDQRGMFQNRVFSKCSSYGSSVSQVGGFVRAHDTYGLFLFFLSSPNAIPCDITIAIYVFPSVWLRVRQLIWRNSYNGAIF